MLEPEQHFQDRIDPPHGTCSNSRPVIDRKSNRFLAAETDRLSVSPANGPAEYRLRTGLNAGWLISRQPIDSFCSTEVVSQSATCQRATTQRATTQQATTAQQPLQCLQLATGQWRPPSQATWFPAPGAAIFYAADLGREAGQTIEIIFLQREPASP